LHAHRVRFIHPETGKAILIESPLPECLRTDLCGDGISEF
jgi:hypothetical protein